MATVIIILGMSVFYALMVKGWMNFCDVQNDKERGLFSTTDKKHKSDLMDIARKQSERDYPKGPHIPR